MSDNVINNFEPDQKKLAVFEMCMKAHDVGDPEAAEWPNNMISTKTVVYASGAIAKKGEMIKHNVNPAELDLCKRLAQEASGLMKGIMLESEAAAEINEFYVAANIDDIAPEAIDEDFIRLKFNNTLFPPATITVEPLKEEGIFWKECVYLDTDPDGTGMGPWKKLVEWFHQCRDFKDTAFVRIGDADKLFDLDEAIFPQGTELPPAVLPRLVVGLTKKGSLAGIFSYVVQT